MAHACELSIQEAEAGGLLQIETGRVLGQLGLHRKAVTQNKVAKMWPAEEAGKASLREGIGTGEDGDPGPRSKGPGGRVLPVGGTERGSPYDGLGQQ